MKKLLSVILVIMMLISTLAFTTNAEEVSDDLYDQMFDYFGGNEIDYDKVYLPDDIPAVIFGGYVKSDGVEIFNAYALWKGVDTMPIVEKYGDCCAYSGGISYPSHTAMFCRIDGKIYTLKEAWDSGLVTDVSPAIGFDKYTRVYPLGDADLDFQLSVMDATLIQLRVAQLVDMSAIVVFDVADVDSDYKLSVMDSTAIQQKLAMIK
ncbi:MAG: hypothetical protein IKB73_03990 [Ruminococcus sp.]|nr:hypothetical protein [Ruminococcus sp.]